MNLKFYNTLRRKKAEFKPLVDRLVTIYSCGPTVYDYAHIGNLRAYIFADSLKKVIKYNDYKVKHVINITDVGHLTSDEDEGTDKIEIAAKEKHQTPAEISSFFENRFVEDIKKLNIAMPEYMPRATEAIAEMIALTAKLVQKNYAYIAKSGVYFDISKFEKYPDLARLDLKKMEFGKRVELQKDKKNPADFALWVLNQPEHLMQWDSPWGKGYPGWHIECSAMAMKYLGETIDIHTGGVDHIPVHHTNEIAQSEAATGKQFVRFWMHSEFMTIRGAKMAKSEKNFITLNDLITKGYDPLAYRYFILSNHYRSKIDFTWEKLDQAQKTYANIKKTEDKKIDPITEAAYEHEIDEAMADDLDLPKAISLLHSAGSRKLWQKYDSVLSLNLASAENVPAEIQELIKKRETFRKDKQWDKADELRKQLADKGYEIKDSNEGTKLIKI